MLVLDADAAKETAAAAATAAAPTITDLRALRRLSARSRARALPTATWRAVLMQTSICWGLTRLMLLMLTLGVALQQHGNSRAPLTSWDIFGHWWFWDGTFIVGIADVGYAHLSQAAYYPLFPGLVSAATHLFPALGSFYTGLIMANLATLAGCWGLGLLAATERRDTAAAGPVVWVFLASPFAFFLAAPYTDTVFLACATWALLAMRRGWWKRAVLLVALASLSRPFGVLLAPPLVWEFAMQRGWEWRLRAAWFQRRVTSWARTLREGGIALMLGLGATLGLGAYALYCWRRWDDPLAFSHAEHTVDGRATLWPWQTVGLVAHQLTTGALLSVSHLRQALDVVPVLLCLVVTLLVALRRQQPVSFTLYSVSALLLVLATPLTHAVVPDALLAGGRCMLGVVPQWLVLGAWAARWRAARWLLVGGGLMIQAALLLFEFNHGWLI